MIIDEKYISNLKDILISALSFGLESNKESIDRKKALSKFIKSYSKLIDYKTCKLMQFHIDLYLGKRETDKFDNYRDYNVWKSLYSWLKQLEITFDTEDEEKIIKN